MIAIYTRQSIDKKDSISIETQIEFCKREIFEEDFKTYQDKGFSGGNTNRPQFLQLMQDVEENRITKVIVYRLDRISRSLLNFSAIIDLFDKFKVEFISCSEKLDTSTSTGRMMLNLLMVFAQYERESIQQRIKDNYYERGKRGVFLGGNTPFGYDSADVKIANKKTSMLVKNNEQSLIVEKIFDMYIKNNTLGDIARKLNELNIENKRWVSRTVSRILRNPVYVRSDSNVYKYLTLKDCIMLNDETDFNGLNGLISYGEGDTKFTDISGYNIAIGLHEGIIPSDTWLQAQYKIYNNKQIANNGTSKNTWLSGICKCGHCGYAMTYKSQTKNNKKFEYLRCSGRNYKYCDANLKSVNLQKTEHNIFTSLKKEVSNLQMSYGDKKDNKLNNLNLEIELIDKKIDKLVKALLDSNDITVPYLNKAIGELHSKKKELSNQLMKIDVKKRKGTFDVKEIIENWETLSVDKKKEFAQMYIDEIKFYEDDTIDITFKEF